MSSDITLTLADYSHLYSAELQQRLNRAKERTRNAEWQAKSAGTAKEYVGLTATAATARLVYMEIIRLSLVEAFESGKLLKPKWSEAIRRAINAISFTGTELAVLRCRRKIMIEDLDDQYKADRSTAFWCPELWQSCTLASAYLKVRERIFMTDFLMLEMGGCKMLLKRRFRGDVLAYYGTAKLSLLNQTVQFCQVSGKWCPPSWVKAVHIVPKALESEALSYLFGVGEINLSDPRNGITLTREIAEGFKSGLIVFVPIAVCEGGKMDWRCVLADARKHIMEAKVWPNLFWQNISDMPLRFPMPNKPAARFLYLRFLLASLRCIQAGNDTSWAAGDPGNSVWTAPGPYLRRSMLAALVRKLAHFDIPESFYVNMTFEKTDGCAERGKEEEEALAASLAANIVEMWGAVKPWIPKGGLGESGGTSDCSG